MELNDLEKIRLEKALKMREEGNEPYPTRANPSHNTVEAIRAFEADETAPNITRFAQETRAVATDAAARAKWLFWLLLAKVLIRLNQPISAIPAAWF